MLRHVFLFINLLIFVGFGQNMWINEFHYDNNGTDVGEFIEVVVPA